MLPLLDIFALLYLHYLCFVFEKHFELVWNGMFTINKNALETHLVGICKSVILCIIPDKMCTMLHSPLSMAPLKMLGV